LKNWPLQTSVSDVQIDSDDLAHWTIDVKGPNWQVATRYDFLRQEQMIRVNMAEPLWRQVPRALGWMLNYLFTGTLFRVYRASHQYGLALTTFQLMLVWWLTLAGLGGGLIAWLAIRLINGPFAFGLVIGVGTAWLMTPPLTWLLGGRAHLGAAGGWLGLCGESVLGALLLWRRLRSGRWRRAPLLVVDGGAQAQAA